MKYFFFALLLFLASFSYAQVKLDSLQKIWNDQSQADSSRLEAMNAIARSYVFSQPDTTIELSQLVIDEANNSRLEVYKATALKNQGVANLVKSDYGKALDNFQEAEKLYQKLDNQEGIANILNNIGLIYNAQGDFEKALNLYEESLLIRQEIGDQEGVATSLNTIGNIYQSKGDYSNALDYYQQSLDLAEEIKDKKTRANTLNNLGLLYQEQGSQQLAFDYFYKSLKVKEELNDKYGVAVTRNNIGLIFMDREDYEPALDYFNQALSIQKVLGDKEGWAISLENVANAHFQMEEYDLAQEYYQQSFEIRKKIGDKKGISSVLADYALNSLAQGNTSIAIDQSQEAVQVALEIGASKQIMEAAKSLYITQKQAGNLEKALEAHELFSAFKDSVQSAESQRQLIAQEFKSEYEKQALTDSLEFAKQTEVQQIQFKSEMQRARNQQYALYGGLAFVLVMGLMAYGGYRRKKRDNEIISAQKQDVEEQKELVEEKNQKIWDSITYAQRIQTAILPPPRLVKELLPDSFIVYEPKDLVAGDFFWMEDSKDWTFFAVADCTGHGVPGALVSVVCHNALNRSVREFELREPGTILDKTRELVIETFEKSEEEVRDGMDIVLCALNKKTKKLQFAGANNPLYHITELDENVNERSVKDKTHYVHEVKADRQPIGKHSREKSYTNHSLKLKSGDVIYLFSDGFADQFGGPKNKKFKYKPFKKLLLSIRDEEMEKQKELVLQAFNEWKGDEEQIDDVCVMGVRV